MSRIPAALLAVLVLASVPAPASAQSAQDRSTWYASGGPGYWSDGTHVRIDEACEGLPTEEALACSLEAFRSKPFTVIAFVDTGINPYHHDFYAPEFVHHPSEYIDGYPTDATALDLEIPTNSYNNSVDSDADVWEAIETDKLYWIPRTRIVGAMDPGGAYGPILDRNGHGTGVASVAAGRIFGAHPNALIVSISSLGDRALRWAAEQPWIDIVSNSWGALANAPTGSRNVAHEAVASGKVVVFAAGNGVTNTGLAPDRASTLTSPYQAVPGIIAVGAASPMNGQSYWWHSIPPDVSSFGRHWPAAHPFHTSNARNFGGTSCAAPVTAGVLSAALERARSLVGDTGQGAHADGLAIAATGHPLPTEGPLADGRLTRDELRDAVLKTAFPVEAGLEGAVADPFITPTTPAYYPFVGYGVVDRDSKERALTVIEGTVPLPDRSDVDAWMSAVRTVRQHLWKPWPEIQWRE